MSGIPGADDLDVETGRRYDSAFSINSRPDPFSFNSEIRFLVTATENKELFSTHQNDERMAEEEPTFLFTSESVGEGHPGR